MDYHDKKDCYFCPRCDINHAICWDCLDSYLDSSSGQDSANAFDTEQNIVCCFCRKAIDVTSLKASCDRAKACLLKVVDINTKKKTEKAIVKAYDEGVLRIISRLFVNFKMSYQKSGHFVCSLFLFLLYRIGFKKW